MLLLEGNDLNSIYRRIVDCVYNDPEFLSSPRGQETREVLSATFVLHDPRSRIITSPARRVNYGFAVGEFTWYWTGKNDLDYISQYNRRLVNFSDDGMTLNSAYGRRIFGRERSWSGPLGQWRVAIEKIKGDPDSRQAVIRILAPDDLKEQTKDVPCTCTLQFLLREGRLHMHVYMRSNDVFWGLPYDVFSFTLMQECMTLELSRELRREIVLGDYIHTAGSLHIYQRHFKDAEAILSEPYESGPAMPPLEGLDSLWRVCGMHLYLAQGADVPPSLWVNPGTGEHWLADKLIKHWDARLAK